MELNNEMMENLNTIFVGNSLQILSTLRDKSVNCCITSPPYYGLRDYGTGEWIGGDPNCSHMRDNKNPNPDNFIPTRGKITSGSGDEIFRSICKNCGAVRQDQQIGLEESPEAYVANLVKIFREVKRVLRNDGTVWLKNKSTTAMAMSWLNNITKTPMKSAYAEYSTAQAEYMKLKAIKDLAGFFNKAEIEKIIEFCKILYPEQNAKNEESNQTLD